MSKLRTLHPLLLSLLSGLLFWLAWTPNSFPFLVFFAFIPLFLIVDKAKNGYQFFIYTYLGLFCWNLFTTWWIWNASMIGAWLAILVNSLLMMLPWWGYRKAKQYGSPFFALSAFILFWLSFEFLHQLDWGLSWPWLTLGNIFANRISWIQWYEWTGTAGGSLWILLVNISLYLLYLHRAEQKKLRREILLLIGLLLFPIGISLLVEKREIQTQAQQSKAGIQQRVVIVQPNIDPYEKLNTLDLEAQCNRLVKLSEKSIDSNTHLLLWPETALYSGGGIDENNLQSLAELQPVRNLLQQYPRLHLLTGIESYRVFSERNSLYARPIDNTGNYYELYNGALLTTHADSLQFYHKSMLVPGVETLPRFLLFMAPLFEKMGGTAGGYARQEKRIPLPLKNDLLIAPAICYESIYGDFLRQYIQRGANVIAIITNDGWWGNTPGYQQHQAYARLRAIETRKWVLRSANTGVSCFINPLGNITQQSEWWTPATLVQNIEADNRKTFFVRYGDLIGKYALLFSLILILRLIQLRFNRKQHSSSSK